MKSIVLVFIINLHFNILSLNDQWCTSVNKTSETQNKLIEIKLPVIIIIAIFMSVKFHKVTRKIVRNYFLHALHR